MYYFLLKDHHRSFLLLLSDTKGCIIYSKTLHYFINSIYQCFKNIRYLKGYIRDAKSIYRSLFKHQMLAFRIKCGKITYLLN